MDVVDADGGALGGATISKRYLWGQAVDQILAEETAGGATVWELADNLGSVRDQMTNAGAIISYAFRAASTPFPDEITFTGDFPLSGNRREVG